MKIDTILLAGPILALLVGAQSASAEIRRVLLSVEGLKIGAAESIRAFRIETWGVQPLAVCQMPPSWELKSEKFEDPEGYLSGRSDVHGQQMAQLREMYLVDVYD